MLNHKQAADPMPYKLKLWEVHPHASSSCCGAARSRSAGSDSVAAPAKPTTTTALRASSKLRTPKAAGASAGALRGLAEPEDGVRSIESNPLELHAIFNALTDILGIHRLCTATVRCRSKQGG
mmetsp:Transcript_94864/g.268552  ORF Transcript_94864/g.268552 Transcript_94864/m.268552 type:complete len:123 (+) Transcript_94864:353-721(+)